MPELEPFSAAAARTIVSRLPMSENKTGDWRTLRPAIDAAACTGCLICWKYCPEACVSLTEKVPSIDFSYCKGCGICAAECPTHCIAMDAEAEP